MKEKTDIAVGTKTRLMYGTMYYIKSSVRTFTNNFTKISDLDVHVIVHVFISVLASSCNF